jgi:hypothetical protein
MADAEGDDSLDEDMMDKISSSPSIDDGGYSLPPMWPERSDSLVLASTPTNSPISPSVFSGLSSSPFVETPDHYPLSSLAQRVSQQTIAPRTQSFPFLHEYLGLGSNSIGEASSTYEDEGLDILGPLPNDTVHDVVESYDNDYVVCLTDELFAVQPELDSYNIFNDDFDSETMTIPYESSDEEEDDDIPFPEDSRFIDSGWGGECLQESEDIDFDLVYALHTFVATVEGQANATKGDTMVLLDDSNSYWWLVRIVKDSSIGMWVDVRLPIVN